MGLNNKSKCRFCQEGEREGGRMSDLICRRCGKKWTGVISHIFICGCLWFLGRKSTQNSEEEKK